MSLLGTSPAHVVWLSAAGTGAGFGLLESIRERWGRSVRVIAADINPAHLVAATTQADEFVQVPPVASPEFPAFLLAALQRHKVDTYVPILDEEIVLATKLQEAGRLPEGVRHLMAPGAEAATLCQDKLATARWLESRQLPTPHTVPLAEAQLSHSGLFLKPRHGRGSLGARLVTTPEELTAARKSGEELIAQEVYSRPEVTVDVFRSRGGTALRAVCRERLETKAGVCTKARVFDDPELTALARALAEGLSLHGTFCFQVMRRQDPEGWGVTDINPRPGAGTRMTCAVGVDVLAAALADAWGEAAVPLPDLPRPRFVVRQYACHVLDPRP